MAAPERGDGEELPCGEGTASCGHDGQPAGEAWPRGAGQGDARGAGSGDGHLVRPLPKSFAREVGQIEHEVQRGLGALADSRSFAGSHEAVVNEVINGFFCSYAVGFEGQVKLKDYDLRRVVQFGGLLCMFCKGTVFNMDRFVGFVCLQQCVIVVMVAALGFYGGASDDNVETFGKLATQTTSLVPLILGLYISNSLARWWNLREISIGTVFSCLTDLTMLMAVQRPEPEWKPLHAQLTKFGLVSIQLIIKAARRIDDISDLMAQDLLTQDEVDYLVQLEAFQRPMAVWAWILRLCQFGWVGLPPPEFNPIQMLCVKAKNSIDNIYVYLRTQLPFAYVHLVACLAHVQNVSTAIHAGLKISMDASNPETWIQEICMAAMVSLIYQGLLALSYILEDPFGDDMLDFPVKSYTAYVMASVRAVQEAQWNFVALDKLKARLQVFGGS